ncbi:MAG: hypothetical protein H0V34_15005 [Gammaproteobacteria bacterium]|nr:hypothetical protein [Gammaproteobacteria bacterium]
MAQACVYVISPSLATTDMGSYSCAKTMQGMFVRRSSRLPAAWNQIKYREARIDELTRQRLPQYAAKLCARLNCHDYARFDFRADSKGEIKLLEVNPNPAWCWEGELNIIAGIAGFTYSQFLEMLLKAALGRVE